MMTKLSEWAKENKLIGFFIKIACFIVLNLISAWFEIKAYFRTIGLGSQKYKELKKFKNVYKGKRCFVVAMGPSLTMEDLDLLKSEITFGMNSVCKIYDKTSFRPTYYGIQDYLVYDELKDFIHGEYDDKSNIFVSDRIERNFSDCMSTWNIFPLNHAYNAYNRWFNDIFKVKISGDLTRMVYDGFSITISLIQIAMYMGFDEIYLVGADCNFDHNNLHFVNHDGSVDTTLDTAAERNFAGYRATKVYADKHNIKIYNATRGGKLEIFERKNLDEVLQKNDD